MLVPLTMLLFFGPVLDHLQGIASGPATGSFGAALIDLSGDWYDLTMSHRPPRAGAPRRG